MYKKGNKRRGCLHWGRWDPFKEYTVRIKKKNQLVKEFTIDFNDNKNNNVNRMQSFYPMKQKAVGIARYCPGSFVKKKVFVYSCEVFAKRSEAILL